MERVGGRQEKIEGHCSTGQSPQWAVVPMAGEEEEEEEGGGGGGGGPHQFSEYDLASKNKRAKVDEVRKSVKNNSS